MPDEPAGVQPPGLAGAQRSGPRGPILRRGELAGTVGVSSESGLQRQRKQSDATESDRMASEAVVSPDVRKGTQLYSLQAGRQECPDVAQEV